MASKKDWISSVADRVEANVRRRRPDGNTVVCASGISPSGPIHLGNLRELMTVHLVADELLKRGWQAKHIHSWDDFDRLRKAPAGAPDGFEEHIGRPLADVPDPWGEYESYAVRHMSQFMSSVEALGIRPQYVRQSIAYRRGDYNTLIKVAVARRREIFNTLAEHQTLDRHSESYESRLNAYNPYKVYCERCNKDFTKITAWDDATNAFDYCCDNCGYEGHLTLDEKVTGKLVWKVDWPMRWSHEQVDFEPGGEDHSSPGSSFTVAQKIASEIYGQVPPVYVGYAFVGAGGKSKISSSAGTLVTPQAALDILEPSIVRWLYTRREPGQKFDIDFGQEVLRLYDEWDAFGAAVATGKASETQTVTYTRSTRSSSLAMPQPRVPISFRLLSSVSDITQGNHAQILRIVRDHGAATANPDSIDDMEPRLTCAMNWSSRYQLEEDRTFIREKFDEAAYAELNASDVDNIQRLVSRLESDWTLAGLTKLLYGIPKIALGLSEDAPATEELKVEQRRFFAAIYRLLTGRDTGPRLPTLFLSIGADRVRCLLSPSVG